MINCECVNWNDKDRKTFCHSFMQVPRVGEFVETHGQIFEVVKVLWQSTGIPLLYLVVQNDFCHIEAAS